VETYHEEIQALIKDLELQDVHIEFERGYPDPDEMCVFQDINLEGTTQKGFIISFRWSRIADNHGDLRFGLIPLAEVLYTIAQQVKKSNRTTPPECECDLCRMLADGVVRAEAHEYAYDAGRWLLTMFRYDEIEALSDYGCCCRQCRKDALYELQQQTLHLSV